MDEFEMRDEDAASYGRCLTRLHTMLGGIQKYVEQIRLREGVLSHSQITGTVQTKGEWHSLQAELAIARAASLDKGTRLSLAGGWMQTQAKVLAECADGSASSGSDASIRPIHHYQTGQIVLRLAGEGLGLIRTVYRGAVVSNKKAGGTRSLRATKAAVYPLPQGSVSKVRLIQLTPSGPEKFFA